MMQLDRSSLTTCIKLRISSYIEETGYMMQPDRSRLGTCTKLRKIYDDMMTPG